MGDRISVDINSGVADVRLIRRDKMNALDKKMLAALVETGDAWAENETIRAVVISGKAELFAPAWILRSSGIW